MDRTKLFTALVVLWVALAVLQFVNGSPLVGALFALVAILNAAVVVQERRGRL